MVPLFVKFPLMVARIVSPKLNVPPELTVTCLKLAGLPLPQPIFSVPLMMVLFDTVIDGQDASQEQPEPTLRSWPTIIALGPLCPPFEPLILKSLRTVSADKAKGRPPPLQMRL